jgi:ubiquinone/menaquinone biosynthesis C-methylase UbiE
MSQSEHIDTLREWRESAAHWQTHAQTIRTMFAPVTSALIEDADIGEGDHVIDVAGGTGEPSLTIAEVVGPSGSVTCTDAVAEMVNAARAEARRRNTENISFRQCVADSLPFGDSLFDAAICRLGVMFFPDPLSGLREMLRVTKSGGSLSFAVWYASKSNPFAYLITDVLARHIPAPPVDPDAPQAFRFAEPKKLAGLLKVAGVEQIRERLLEFHIEAPITRDEFWKMRSGTSGTLREKLDAMPAGKRGQIAAEVKEAVAPFFPDEQMSFPAQMLVVTGDKPREPLR